MPKMKSDKLNERRLLFEWGVALCMNIGPRCKRDEGYHSPRNIFIYIYMYSHDTSWIFTRACTIFMSCDLLLILHRVSRLCLTDEHVNVYIEFTGGLVLRSVLSTP